VQLFHLLDRVVYADTLDTVTVADSSGSVDTVIIVGELMQDRSDVAGVLLVFVLVVIIVGILAHVRPIRKGVHHV